MCVHQIIDEEKLQALFKECKRDDIYRPTSCKQVIRINWKHLTEMILKIFEAGIIDLESVFFILL